MNPFKLKKKNFHNYLSGILVKASILLTQLFLIPVFISSLGVERYGEWIIITTVPSYLLLSDLGLTQTVTNELCRLINLKQYIEQEKLFQSAFTFLLLLGLGLVCLGGIFFMFADYDAIFNLKYISGNECLLILSFYILNVVLSLVFRLVIGYFKAFDQFYKHEYALAITYIFDFIATLAILKAGLPLYSIPLAYVVMRLIVFVFVHFYFRSNEFYKLGITKDLKPAKDMLPVSIKLSFFSLGYALLLQGNTFVVGTLLGTTAVVTFNTIRTLVNSVKAGVSIFYLPTMPEFAFLMSENKVQETKMKMDKLLVQIFVMSLVICLSIFLLKDYMMHFWLKRDLVYSNIFIVFMLLSIILQNVWNAGSMLPLAVNKLNGLSLFPLLCLVALVAQYFIINLTKLEGVAVSLFVLDILMLIIVIGINKTLLKPSV